MTWTMCPHVYEVKHVECDAFEAVVSLVTSSVMTVQCWCMVIDGFDASRQELLQMCLCE